MDSLNLGYLSCVPVWQLVHVDVSHNVPPQRPLSQATYVRCVHDTGPRLPASFILAGLH